MVTIGIVATLFYLVTVLTLMFVINVAVREAIVSAARDLGRVELDDEAMDRISAEVAARAEQPPWLASQNGQGFIEYALILSLIAVIVMVVLIVLGGTIINIFTNIEAAWPR